MSDLCPKCGSRMDPAICPKCDDLGPELDAALKRVLAEEQKKHIDVVVIPLKMKIAALTVALRQLTVKTRDIMRRDKEIIVHGGWEHDLDVPCEICALLAADEGRKEETNG